MKRVLNFGSINVDHVYKVDHFAQPGETIECTDYRRFAGGKGLNQSIALAQAGAKVCHAGFVGEDGEWLDILMQEKGVNTDHVKTYNTDCGHAIIQVNAKGENSIVIVGGVNRKFKEVDIYGALLDFNSNDYLLVQNEVNLVPETIRAAKKKGMKVVFNPAPMTAEVLKYPLELVDILVVNETEAFGLTGETKPGKIYKALLEKYPDMAILLTQGSKGSAYATAQARFYQSAVKVDAVDTTGAGDTFIGFFLAELIRTNDPKASLLFATKAAAIAVTRRGAADSIPNRKEVEEM
jgi:ribokinase